MRVYLLPFFRFCLCGSACCTLLVFAVVDRHWSPVMVSWTSLDIFVFHLKCYFSFIRFSKIVPSIDRALSDTKRARLRTTNGKLSVCIIFTILKMCFTENAFAFCRCFCFSRYRYFSCLAATFLWVMLCLSCSLSWLAASSSERTQKGCHLQ